MGVKPWEVSGAFRARAEPLIPPPARDPNKPYKRAPGAGRKRKPARLVFEGIVYVLRTGCRWKAPPKGFGSSSSVHRHFLEWERAGVSKRLWGAGLAGYDGTEGVARLRRSIDGAMAKALTAGEAVGPNPTDRGKKWDEAPPARGRAWRPAVDRRCGREPARRGPGWRGPRRRREAKAET
jgi:transposase